MFGRQGLVEGEKAFAGDDRIERLRTGTLDTRALHFFRILALELGLHSNLLDFLERAEIWLRSRCGADVSQS